MEVLSNLCAPFLVFLILLSDSWSYVEAKPSLCFSVIGDFGGLPYAPYTTSTQRRIAEHMAKATQKNNCRFVVALGDNFYHTGVRHEDDPRFRLTFENVYNHPSLQVPWYVIAGNHDHIQNVSAQIAYSKKSKRWRFPHLFYSKVHRIPKGNREVHLVMIDTTVLCSRNKHKKNPSPSPEEQLHWIDKELGRSKSDYVIVAGHHPILSAGVHGNTDCLVRTLKPLLEKHSVTAYFSGHDHNLQHIYDSKVHYFVSGSGNFYNGWAFNKRSLPQGTLKFFHGVSGGFALADALENALQLKFINELDQTIYQTKIHPRQRRRFDIRQYPELLISFLRSPFKVLSKLLNKRRRSTTHDPIRTWNFFS